MLKQILSRLPRKALKAESGDLVRTDTGTPRSSSGSPGSRPTSAKKTSSVFPTNAVAGVEPSAAFNDVPIAEKLNLFVSKLNLCCTVFDFNDPSKNSIEKDVKRQTLIELVDFMVSGPPRFTEPVIAAMCKMCATNLFRVFPPNYRSNSLGGENDDDEPTFDPAWSHLQLVYDLLLKFVTSSCLDAKVAKKYIDHSFILRPFIRKSMSNIFYRFVFETERNNGIAEMLEIFGSVISGFALPLKEEHKIFLWRALIPLHKPKSVGVYFQQLSYCVTQFIEKEPKLASSVIKGLLRYWPITNSQKEVMFLGELEEILEAINMVEFQKIMVPLFWRIGCCINSFHFSLRILLNAEGLGAFPLVAERALFLWNNDQIVNLIAHNRQVLIPVIFPALERNAQSHWNQAVLNLSLNVRKMLSEMDDELFLACHARFKEEESRLSLEAQKRKETWEQLENEASLQPVSGNTAVLVTPLATSITC
ncbi:Serine/threonine protein phosphatase 2A 57 kDa regulatory subunit B' kappa isoform [Vitis vinifera]|uniref:Serine/threonine protein phosphatase 2A regulatory subunit n=1 Tax=Vitis vinifera TaxID=29760 RepID=A0A438KEM6_VITVI|nr:Serine/threonine protein phosphatase 2A 57 kDa regulatory subunit B' kappa isoform [Vitis vinifera]